MWKDIVEWFRSPPRISRLLLIPSLTIPLVMHLHLVHPLTLVYNFKGLFYQGEVSHLFISYVMTN